MAFSWLSFGKAGGGPQPRPVGSFNAARLGFLAAALVSCTTTAGAGGSAGVDDGSDDPGDAAADVAGSPADADTEEVGTGVDADDAAARDVGGAADSSVADEDADPTPDADLGAAEDASADTAPDAASDSGAVSDSGAATDSDAAPVDAPDTSDDALGVPSECLALRSGWNHGFLAGDAERSFMLVLPDGVDAGGPWPVVFAWHGYDEDASDITPFLRDEVDGPAYRFILVVPEDLGLPFPIGADWDDLDLSDGCLEADLFDAVLDCLDARWGVDAERVHTLGFSSGGITSNALGVLRGERLASVASLSGAYWSNPANPNPLASWPALDVMPPRYTQLLVWGGVADAAFGFNFALTALNDQVYLNARGHDVVACAHGRGHALPDAPNGSAVAAFFAAHPRGVERSPWRAGLPAGYPPLTCAVFPGAD